MTDMKAAVLVRNRDMRVVDIPRAEAGEDGILIRVQTVGVCGTDLHTYKTGIFKEMSLPMKGGALFGHEFSGDIVDIGDSVQRPDLAIGDRVSGIALGAYAEYCRCGPEAFGEPVVFKLPDAVSYEEAATLEPLTVSLATIRRANPAPGEKVLIIGAGMIGLGCVQVMNALFPDNEIIISDISEKRLESAREFGADITINAMKQNVVEEMKALTGEKEVLYNNKLSANIDVVIECAGLELTLNQALEAVKPEGGRLIVVALYEDMPTIDVNQMVTKNVTVKGVLAYTNEEILEALDLMASGKVDRTPLITHKFALADIVEAFETQIDTAESLKAVVLPSS